MQKEAKITSKGQITIPREIRKLLGVQAGDKLRFDADQNGVRVRPVRESSRFGKYRGIGNPEIPSGRKAVTQWTRAMRGK